jgi:hypothetical protein
LSLEVASQAGEKSGVEFKFEVGPFVSGAIS